MEIEKIIKSKRKSFCIEINDEGKIILRVPYRTKDNEIKNFFNGSSSQLLTRNVIAFMHFDKEILEVHRGIDYIFNFFIAIIEKHLRIKFTPYYISSEALFKIINNYSISLNQVYFKFVNGFVFEMYKGKYLQHSEFIKEKLRNLHKNLRIITVIPKIRFEKIPKSVSINGDRGTIKFSVDDISRNELIQIINLIYEANKK